MPSSPFDLLSRTGSWLPRAVAAVYCVTFASAAAGASASDAAEIIEHSLFPAGMPAAIAQLGKDAALALPHAVQWFGGWNDWLWTAGLAAAGVAVGMTGRWATAKLLARRSHTVRGGRAWLWIGRELVFFICVAAFFACVPPWPRIHGLALTIAASWGLVNLMGSLTLVVLRVSRSRNLPIARDVRIATATVAAGYIVLGLLRLSGVEQMTRTIVGLPFWLLFLWRCASMLLRFRSTAGKWRAADLVADPVSTLLLGQRSLFFGIMLATIGVATVLSALISGPHSYKDGVISIALLAVLPTVVALASAVIGGFSNRLGHWQQAVVRSVRLLIFVCFWILLAKIWGINPFDTASSWFGQRIGRVLIDICIAVALAYLLWELMRTGLGILAAPTPSSALPTQDADHVHTATRLQTFIPLLRTILLCFILAATGMIALAAMGVNIGPLLAGAGIVGVAIGFGSQSLVKDVISGVFFLADDAFRIGEWVEVGNAKGTVEAITLRSLKLRHSRGALFTVPFGSISMVNNQSRDYVIVKLEFMIAFDSDLVKAKKVVKEISSELESDPELGSPLLQPIKFQGVRQMGQYGMVVGVKFTARPGEQWTLRREVFQRVRDAFSKAGIAFARPQVIVQVPEGAPVSRQAIEAAAGFITSNDKDDADGNKTGGDAAS